MITGAGLSSRPVTGVLLFLALGGFWTSTPVWAGEADAESDSGAATEEQVNPGTLSPWLKRDFVPPYLPALRLDLAYQRPLITEIAYTKNNLGPTGCLNLPGDRRLKAKLEFALILHGEVRRLAPEADGATLTVNVHPGWISEDWIWPDGLTLQRTYFQPLGAEALGVRCVFGNKTAQTLSGVRLSAQLSNPEMFYRHAPGRVKTNFSDLTADPRSETLLLADTQNDAEGCLAFGWGPQGGFIGSGGYQDESSLEMEKLRALNSSQVAVSMETPVWDVNPNQRREAIYWIAWGVEPEAARGALERQRQRPGFGNWEKKARATAVKGPQFECRDPYAEFLFKNAKVWAGWMQRRDEFGNQYLYSPRETEPARPAALALGAWGWLTLGQSQALRQHLENWLEQKYEPVDTAYLVLAMHGYFLWTHDSAWLVENAGRLADMLDALAEMDINGDGLPELSQTEAVLPGLSAWAKAEGKSAGFFYQGLAPSVAAVSAFRKGAELLSLAGKENLQAAAKFRALADLGEETLKKGFWNAKSGQAGFYAYARLPESQTLVRIRSLDAVLFLIERLGPAGFQKAAAEELWENPHWRTGNGVWRSMPSDEAHYRGEGSLGQGSPDPARTLALLRYELNDPDQATAAAEAFLSFARQLVGDPGNLGGLSTRPGQSVIVDLESLQLMEMCLQGLAGLDFSLAGLRVHVPPYQQDLGVRLANLKYAGAILEVEVKGAGTHGHIFVNNQPWESNRLIPWNAFPRGKARIVIQKEP